MAAVKFTSVAAAGDVAVCAAADAINIATMGSSRKRMITMSVKFVFFEIDKKGINQVPHTSSKMR